MSGFINAEDLTEQIALSDPLEKNFKITEEILDVMNKEIDETGLLSSESVRDLLKNNIIKADLLRMLIEANDERDKGTIMQSEETF